MISMLFLRGLLHFVPLPYYLSLKYNLGITHTKEAEQVDKEKILAALNEIQNGGDARHYHDELETLIGLIDNITDEDVAAAWEGVHVDAE